MDTYTCACDAGYEGTDCETSKSDLTELLCYSGCYNLSADRIVAPYGLHAYMKRHDSDDSPVAAKLQRFGSFRRKALYKYGLLLLFIIYYYGGLHSES